MMLNKLEIFPSWSVEYYGIKTKTTYIKFELNKVEEPSAKEPDVKARNEPTTIREDECQYQKKFTINVSEFFHV